MSIYFSVECFLPIIVFSWVSRVIIWGLMYCFIKGLIFNFIFLWGNVISFHSVVSSRITFPVTRGRSFPVDLSTMRSA